MPLFCVTMKFTALSKLQHFSWRIIC